jgi:hypothetical protein
LFDERGVKARRSSGEERAVLLWCAVFKDKPQEASCTEERTPRSIVLQRFEHAMALGMHGGRAVIGMWLLDSSTQQGDVIKIHGLAPEPIRARHEAYVRETKNPE